MIIKRLYFFLLLSLSFLIYSQTVFTFRTPEGDKDSRYDYDNAVLKLALDKTVETYGSYILKPSGVMNFDRMRFNLKNNIFENPMFKQSANEDDCREFDYVNFPVDLGIVGYRVFFVSPEKEKVIENIKSIEELQEFTILQGSGWKDIEILKNSGFKLVEVPKYESLFYMISKNRGDLLSRGINEVKDEMSNFISIKDLILNKSLMLYYPLPRFFYTSKGNTEAVKRVTEGLIRAFNDGSLVELWKSYYQESIDLVKPQNRLLFEIENPLIKNINSDYKMYIINSFN